VAPRVAPLGRGGYALAEIALSRVRMAAMVLVLRKFFPVPLSA
jgi:hypothetical protein